MPAKTSSTTRDAASPKRSTASPTAGKRTTPRASTQATGSTSKRSAVSPPPVPKRKTPTGATSSPAGHSPTKRSSVRHSPEGSRNASRRASAGATPSRRQSASTQNASRRNSVDPLQPVRCTVDGEPLAELRQRLSRSSAALAEEQSMPSEQFMAALNAMSSEPDFHETSGDMYPTEDPVPRAVAPKALREQPPAKPVAPERVDELTSMLESISNEAHVRVSVNDLVAFEYVDQASHFWRWGLGTVAALPGPRLAQLLLWTSSDMSDIPPAECPLSPEEREAAMRSLDDVQKQRQEHELEVQEINKQLQSLAATYRAERHEYHQEMEMAERTLREARHEVRSLDEKDWRECRSYTNPPDIVEFILGAVMCVLGEHTSSWNDTLRVVRSRDFITNIAEFDPSRVSAANKRVLQRKYLKDKRFTYQNAMNGSRALGALQRWVAAQSANFKASNKLQKFDISHRDEHDEMADLQRRLDAFNKALAKLESDEDELLEKLGDRPERVRFAVTPRPTDVAAAEAAAADGAVDDESLRGTRRTWTFTDESLVVLRSSILVNYDTPDSTMVVLTDAQIEQLKGGLQARAAPYVQEKQAENKQRKLEDEIAKLRGDMAEAKNALDELKAAQNDHERALAAKERQVEDLKAQLDEAPARDGDEDDADDQAAEYPTEDGGAPADKQQRSRGVPAPASQKDGPDSAASPADGEAADARAPADKDAAADAAEKPTPEAIKALEDALAEKDQEIDDLKDRLKEAEDALDAAEDEKARALEKAEPGTNGDGEDDDDQSPEYPTEDDGAPARADRALPETDPAAAAAAAEAAAQKAYRLKELLDALEKEAKSLRKAKDRADGASIFTMKKMAKNAALVDVMEVEDDADEDDTPYVDPDDEAAADAGSQ